MMSMNKFSNLTTIRSIFKALIVDQILVVRYSQNAANVIDHVGRIDVVHSKLLFIDFEQSLIPRERVIVFALRIVEHTKVVDYIGEINVVGSKLWLQIRLKHSLKLCNEVENKGHRTFVPNHILPTLEGLMRSFCMPICAYL